MAGVEPLRNAEGKAVPVYNIYDREKLANLGYRGWEIEDAVSHAMKSGKPGAIMYNFVRSELSDRIVAAWEKQEARMREADTLAGDEVYSTDAADIDIEPEALAVVCFQFAKNRKALMSSWKISPPLIKINGDSKTEEKDGVTITVGTWKCYSLNLNEAARKHMGIKS